MRAIVLVSLLLACSNTTPNDDAGSDATADTSTEDAVTDVGDGGVMGCDVQTCNGTVFLLVGQSVPNGDVCGNTCSCELQGGFLIGQCTFGSDCPCNDASAD